MPTLPDGEEKKSALTELCQCFHPYLMKYLVMIVRGHLPLYGYGKDGLYVNKDVVPFIKFFLPKGTPVNKQTMVVAVRHFHLAFKGMETEEVYDVLMEQLIRAVHKYDPHYTDKVRVVAEAINNDTLSKQSHFSVADLNRLLEFDSNRYLRLLCRRGFLTSFTERAAWKKDSSPGSGRLPCRSLRIETTRTSPTNPPQ